MAALFLSHLWQDKRDHSRRKAGKLINAVLYLARVRVTINSTVLSAILRLCLVPRACGSLLKHRLQLKVLLKYSLG